jgi:hypothetical protein
VRAASASVGVATGAGIRTLVLPNTISSGPKEVYMFRFLQILPKKIVKIGFFYVGHMKVRGERKNLA